MELTFTNHNQIEQGVLQDFTLDLAYGKDENDFEIVTSENELEQGWYWLIPDTEYGGIVDEVEATTNVSEVTYRGRSFQGILESFNMLEISSFDGLVVDNDNLIINGLPSQILSGIVSQLQLPFTVETDDEEIVSTVVERNQGVYSFLRNAFEPSNYKVKFNSDFSIRLTGSIDFASDDYYDTTQFAVKVKTSQKKPNHLIGVYKRDGENTIVKHIYFDEDGVVQPYYQLDNMHGLEPLHDYEYERVPDNKIITGIDEVVEVIEGGSTVETMDLVTPLTSTDGNTPFKSGKPKDWNTKVYTDYYYISGEDESGELTYANPEIENEYEAFTVPSGTYTQEWWANHWNECYKRSGSSPDYVYTQLSKDDCQTEQHADIQNPTRKEWNKNYSKYSYRVSQDTYANFEGIPVYDYEKQFQSGSAWRDNKGDFYIYVHKKKWKIVSKWKGNKKTQYCYDDLANKSPDGKHSFKHYFGKITKKKETKKIGTTTWTVYKPTTYWEGYMKLSDYCAYKKKKLSSVKFESGKYYLQYEKYKKAPNYPSVTIYKVYNTVEYAPPTSSGGNKITYYYPKDTIKPTYEQGLYYRKVKNNYGELCKKMLERYDEIVNSLTTIEPNIDVDIAEFDVGDIIGSTHPFTKEKLQTKITKKIVKGNSFGLTVDYEI